MENSQKIELLEKSLKRLIEWIRSADAKIAPILAIDTSMLAILVGLATSSEDPTVFALISTSIAVLVLLVSLICLFIGVFPRIEGPKGSLIYFREIRTMSTDDYSRELQNLTEEEYLLDLIKQCHRNAGIATSKYKHVRLSMIFLFIALIPWLLAVFMLYKG